MRVCSPSPAFAPLAEITAYTRIQIIRRFIGRSVLQIDFPIQSETVSYVQKNCWIITDVGEPFIIRNIQQTEKTVTVYAYGGHFGFEGRVTIPDTGMYAIEKTGSADAVVKEFIRKSTPVGNRSLNITCAANQGGATISDQSRYKNLGDEVSRVLITAGRGEQFSLYGGSIIFDTYAGTDRSASCVFDLKYKNIKDFKYTLDATKAQTTPIVGGAGEGADREMYITGDDAAGWDRREVFIDARDVDAGDLDKLTQRAQQALIGDAEQVQADVSTSANLVFGVDYSLGDIVTVNVPVKTYAANDAYFNPVVVTISLVVRITEATETIDNGVRTIDLTFGSTIQQSDSVQTRSAISQLQTTEGSDINSNLSAILDKVYPVGSIYISITNTNPGTLFGGTWAAFGAGKTLVGLAAGDPDFGAVEAQPGFKSIILDATQMPAHVHVMNQHTHGNGTLAIGGGRHIHKLAWGPLGTMRYISLSGSNGGGVSRSNGYSTGYAGEAVYDLSLVAASETADGWNADHSHVISGALANADSSMQSTGGGGAHNNIQPSIVVYMWKRTA